MITPNFVGQTYTDNLTGDIWQANSLTEGDWSIICSPGSSGGTNVEGAGDPTAVTPDFEGQVYKDVLTGNLWRSNSLTLGDWTLELQNSNIQWEPTGACIFDKVKFVLLENNGFTSLNFTTTTSGGINIEEDFTLETITGGSMLTIDQTINASFVVDNLDVLASISFSVLTDVTDTISISNAPLLATISYPSLVNVSIFTLDTLPALTTLDIGALVTVSGAFTITACDILTGITISNLVAAGSFSIQSNPLLTTISLLSWVPADGSINNFSDNALNLATVNLILAQAVANAGFVTGTINLFGGTNAAPAGQGATDVTTLQGRGVTVTHN